MSGFADAHAQNPRGRPPYAFDDGEWSGPCRRPPLPAKILIVAAAFWLFHPLGIALLIYFVWQAARLNRCWAFRGADFGRSWGGSAPFGRRGGAAFRNTAFEQRRRDALKALDEEAEAFDAFERKQREARDRAAFERFIAERDAAKGAQGPN